VEKEQKLGICEGWKTRFYDITDHLREIEDYREKSQDSKEKG